MSKNIVICCDGTWNSPDQTDRGRVIPSNVVKIARAAVETDPATQVLWYENGVGTGGWFDKLSGGGLGVGLWENIQRAYRQLARLYEDGDRIFLFGFSRGAFTVRSLAGLVGRCGLPTGDADAKVFAEAYDLYRTGAEAASFKSEQRDVRIHLIGVWDTVGALGIPKRFHGLRKVALKLTGRGKLAHGFHDVTLGDHVDHAYHAVAIDERRGPFEPALWKTGGSFVGQCEQAWFVGVHSNVGGSYVDAGLSDHALMWMIDHAERAGLIVDPMYLALRIDPNAHGELRDSMTLTYKALGEYERTLGEDGTLAERVHASVLARRNHPTNDYVTDNLEDVLDEGGLPRDLPVSSAGLELVRQSRRRLFDSTPGGNA